MESRLTFRNKQTKKAWQRQIREQREKEYTGYKFWQDIDLSLKNARIRPVTREIAKKIIFEYEWLGTLPNCTDYFGIFFDDYCGGVVCFSLGSAGAAGESIAKMYGITQSDIAYLCRGACAFWTPTGSASKLISYSLKLLKKRAKVAIAYSDTDAGEYGTVYQSTNWLCLGKGSSISQLVSPMGQIKDQRNIGLWARKYKVTWKQMRDILIKKGWKIQETNAKYRYAFIIAEGREREELYNRVKKYITEYPKRQ